MSEVLEACDFAEERIDEFLCRLGAEPDRKARLFGEEMPYVFEHEWGEQHAGQTLEYMNRVSEALRADHAVHYVGGIVEAVAALVCNDLDVHSEILEEGGQQFGVIASGSSTPYQLEADTLSNCDMPELEKMLHGNSKLRRELERQESQQADAALDHPEHYGDLLNLLDGMDGRLKSVYEGCLELKEEIAEACKVLAKYQPSKKEG